MKMQIYQFYKIYYQHTEWWSTLFEPLLSTIFTLVVSTDVPGFNQYNISLILADDTSNDKQQTIDLLVEWSSLPENLIIVSIGNADFTKKHQLDRDWW